MWFARPLGHVVRLTASGLRCRHTGTTNCLALRSLARTLNTESTLDPAVDVAREKAEAARRRTASRTTRGCTMEGSGVDSSAADQLVAQWVTLQDVKKDFAAANELYDKMRAMGITPAPKLYSLQGDSKGVDVVKVQTKMDQYALLKQHRDFAGCDAIRLELSRLGVSIIDRHRWWKTSNPKAEAILEAQKMAKKAKREQRKKLSRRLDRPSGTPVVTPSLVHVPVGESASGEGAKKEPLATETEV